MATTLAAAFLVSNAGLLLTRTGRPEAQLRSMHTKSANRIMNELFRPVTSEVDALPVQIEYGSLPDDLPRGCILKNHPNARYEKSGGWLDGDGLAVSVVLPPSPLPPRFTRSWVRSEAFVKEEDAGRRLFSGTLVAPYGLRMLWTLAWNALVGGGQAQKDTVNTGFTRLPGGKCLALMEQCLPCELTIFQNGSFATSATQYDFDGGLLDRLRFPFSGGALTAHLHADPQNGETMGVTYCASGPPAVRVDVLDGEGALARSEVVELPGESCARMVHDCAITAAGSTGGYVLVLDTPLTIRPERMLRDKFPVEYEPEVGARIGLWPRAGGATVWVDIEPCVILHAINAHENADGTVTLFAPRALPETPESFIQSYSTPFLHRWTLDPKRGVCVEEASLNDRVIEFPTIDNRLVGKDARYAFAIAPCTIGGPNEWGPPFEGILIDSVVKLDLQDGTVAGEWKAPEGYYVVSEPTFLPRIGSEPGNGDDGYLLVFATSIGVEHIGGQPTNAHGKEENDGRCSQLFVLDAMRLHEGPEAVTAILRLPAAVPYGLHSIWLDYDELNH